MTHISSRFATSLKAFAALVIVAGVPAYAHADDAAPKVTVSTADLDLSSTQGQATARTRIGHAAARLCADFIPAGEGLTARDNCETEVADAAMPQLDQQVAQAQTAAQLRLAAAQPADAMRVAQLAR